jgi:pyruvate dehydrogenase E2 component (dihydrolipoamide acetyltransferase)
VRHSLNDLLAMAVARAVRQTPAINAQWTEEGIAQLGQVDLSIAVALESGLITPIVRNADRKSLREISAEIAQLAEQARRGRLRPEQYEGGSLTLSNLGMYGVREFAAIVNPPQSAILAAGAVTRQPVVDGDEIRIGHVMSLTLSADHRVVDGAAGAQFLKAVKQLLENPIELIL